jgi:ribosomal protein S18 acetylase RimI-like enzyme
MDDSQTRSATDGAVPVVREARWPVEWRDAIDLMRRVFVDEGFTSATNGAQLFDESRLRGQGELLVAAVGEAVLGAVLIVSLTGDLRQVARDETELEFRLLAVSRDARGAGIGRRLVEECLRRAAARAKSRVVSCTQPSMGQAQALYASLGFVRDERRDWQTPNGSRRLVFVHTLT